MTRQQRRNLERQQAKAERAQEKIEARRNNRFYKTHVFKAPSDWRDYLN